MTTQNHFREIHEKYTQKGMRNIRDLGACLVEEVTPICKSFKLDFERQVL